MDATPPRISVIVPTLNEQERIARVLLALHGQPGVELIVADGGSDDLTCDIAAVHADRCLEAPRGRGRQMNAGAGLAHGAILLFLHADTTLPPGWAGLVTAALADPAVVGGAFALRLDQPGLAYALIGRAATLRSRLTRIPYGDQALFVRRECFDALGGFAELPLLEDADLARRLGRRGRLVLLDTPVVTSARTWQRHGLVRTTVCHLLTGLGWLCGLDAERLARLYRRLLPG